MIGARSAAVVTARQALAALGEALHYVAPVGEKDENVALAMKNIAPYLPTP